MSLFASDLEPAPDDSTSKPSASNPPDESPLDSACGSISPESSSCLGPRCAALILDWLRRHAAGAAAAELELPSVPRWPRAADPAALQGVAVKPPHDAAVNGGRQAWLFSPRGYREEAAVLADADELDAAFDHLDYAVFRRFTNTLTRAERIRLDNSIDNALFKIERFLTKRAPDDPSSDPSWKRFEAIRAEVIHRRNEVEQLRIQARRAEEKLARLANLTPEAFEEFVAEVFECLGFQTRAVGGADDQGVDLVLERQGLRAIVQCKYRGKGVVGSPEVQKLLGAVHRTGSHKGYFVTTSTFTLAAERLAADQPLELIDGPRLTELIRQALGPGATREPEPPWF
ncbi:restriction endonuclease [Isosphaera pallida ATCC 43644]|uniref:Restriction endonuclease n=1 Tax=Isosphaera pallida (strain ATCC 43644 / DSM 9630 / IS1B) TaxID=575540 RepID=E8R3W8_ISOPI|nr:restriction endonuclease [Isosphaera pallida]ADV63698.1 restriction endonuclease [Isosphaera pallida ATCC 43644]